MLRAAISGPFPAKDSPPLEYNLEVIESAPTSDQIQTILSYMPSKATSPSMVFLSAHPSSGGGEERPQTVEGILKLAEKNPKALRWPIVVDWIDGKAAVGDVEGVKGILEHLRKKRDGEASEEPIHKPGWFT
jgi:Protein of unknown function (DUF1687)